MEKSTNGIQTPLSEACEVVFKAIRNNDAYRMSWASNIAMAFVDAFNEEAGPFANLSSNQVTHIANKGADRFINLLTASGKTSTVRPYRKKPVEILAVQYNGINKPEIEEFVGQELEPVLESESAYIAGKGAPIFSLIIPTLEGQHKAMPGDYIIRGVKGEFYPCKPDIFALTYDKV